MVLSLKTDGSNVTEVKIDGKDVDCFKSLSIKADGEKSPVVKVKAKMFGDAEIELTGQALTDIIMSNVQFICKNKCYALAFSEALNEEVAKFETEDKN